MPGAVHRTKRNKQSSHQVVADCFSAIYLVQNVARPNAKQLDINLSKKLKLSSRNLFSRK